MWFLIWRGWGILVVPVLAVCLVAGVMIGAGVATAAKLPEIWEMRIGYTAAALLSGGGLWLITKGLTKPPRRLVDPATGREVLLRRDPGSLFFIPMKAWVIIAPAFCLLMILVMWDGKGLKDRHADLPASADAPADTQADTGPDTQTDASK